MGIFNIFTPETKNNGNWQFLVSGSEGSKLGRSYYQKVIDLFLIPDDISPDHFRANDFVIQKQSLELAKMFDEFNEQKVSVKKFATKSIKYVAWPGDRSPYTPKWFVSAYPDVVNWFAKKTESGDKTELEELLQSKNITEIEDQYGLTKLDILRILVDYFIQKGNKLETQLKS